MPPADYAPSLHPKMSFQVQALSPSDSECLGFSNIWWHSHKRIYKLLYMTQWSEHSFCEHRLNFPISREQRIKSSGCWWVPCALHNFCKEVCLPLGPWCKGRESTCCCRSWAQKGFWVCEHMWHRWAYDLGLQEILHVKLPIKNVKQDEKSPDFPCRALFAVNFFPRHVNHDCFFCSGIQLFQRHDDTQYS